jgi:hypothetical protein
VYDVVALNSPFEIGRFIAYTHVSKSATSSEWNIPSKLSFAISQFDFPPIDISELRNLKKELEKFWKSFQTEQGNQSQNKGVTKPVRLLGEVRKILHNDENGTDGFLNYDGDKSTYFRINGTDRIKDGLCVGLEVTFELLPSKGDKKERAIKLQRQQIK